MKPTPRANCDADALDREEFLFDAAAVEGKEITIEFGFAVGETGGRIDRCR